MSSNGALARTDATELPTDAAEQQSEDDEAKPVDAAHPGVPGPPAADSEAGMMLKEAITYRENLKECVHEWRERLKDETPTADKTEFRGKGLDSLTAHLQHFLCTPVVRNDDTDEEMPPFYRVVDGHRVVTKPTRVELTVPAPSQEFEGWRIVDTIGLRGEDAADAHTCLRVNDALYNASKNPACALLLVMKDPSELGFPEKLVAATRRLVEECPISDPCRAVLVVNHNKKQSKTDVEEAFKAIPKNWPVLTPKRVCSELPKAGLSEMMFDKAKQKDIQNIHSWFAALGAAANERAKAVHAQEESFKQHQTLAELADFIDDAQQLTDDLLNRCLEKAFETEAHGVTTDFSGAVWRFAAVNGRGWNSVQKMLTNPLHRKKYKENDELSTVAIPPIDTVVRPLHCYTQAIRRALGGRCYIPDAVVEKAARRLSYDASYTFALAKCFSSKAKPIAEVKIPDGKLGQLLSSMPSSADLVVAMKIHGASAATMRDAIAEAIDDAVEKAYEQAESDEANDATCVIHQHRNNFAVTSVEEYAVFKDYFSQHKEMFKKEMAAASRLGCDPNSPVPFLHAPMLIRHDETWNRLVYKRVNGLELHQAIERCSTVEDRKQLFELLIKAVQAVHAPGIAHRDLKPDNIMVCYDETGTQPENVVLIDFGSCSLGDENAPGAGLFTTVTNSRSGRYSAPECLSQQRAAYKAADVYSLRVIAADMGWTLPPEPVDDEFCAFKVEERVPGIATDEDAVPKRLNELLEKFKQATLEVVPIVPPSALGGTAGAQRRGTSDRAAIIERLESFVQWMIDERLCETYRRLLTLLTRRARWGGHENPRSLKCVLSSWRADRLRLLEAVADACRARDAAGLRIARRELLDSLPRASEARRGMIYFIVSTISDESALAYVGKTDRTFAERYSNTVKRDLAKSLPEAVRHRWSAGCQRAGVLLHTSSGMPWGASEAAFVCLLGTLFRIECDGINWAIGGRTDKNV